MVRSPLGCEWTAFDSERGEVGRLMSGMDAIIKEFLAESAENLDQLDQDFVVLEKDPGNREVFSRIFRTIHTIKGTCGFLAFGKLEAVTPQWRKSTQSPP